MAQHRDWFSQWTCRKESLIPESTGSINQQDIQVSGETMMLKTIVQNDDLSV
jgi:hypothetical protein